MTQKLYRAAFQVSLLLFLLHSPTGSGGPEICSGPEGPVPPSYFGMHIHHAASGTEWPSIPFGSWRLWDAGVSWPQLEPERGKWDFSLLDRYVKIAAERRVDILLTLGLTPTWASARPNEPSGYNMGNGAEPGNAADWEEYVRTVALRYKGVIHNYEIWNEPNAKASFTGNAATMLLLARSAYLTLKAIDSSITVVSPSATAESGIRWLHEFVSQGGCSYSDVIGYHFYVTPAPPEAMVSLIKRVKGVIQASSCGQKPLWNTESGWSAPKQFGTDEEAASYLMRTYLLNWLMGIQRCYWYAWDNHNWSTLELTSSVDNRITSAGAAYGVIRQWVSGARLRSCSSDHSGLWVCQLDRGASTYRLIWCDHDGRAFAPPSQWHVRSISSWRGEVTKPTRTVMAGPAPLLLVCD